MADTLNVLLLEDDDAHAEAVKRAFRQAKTSVHLTRASNVEEALVCLKESVPNLVIADWVLPDGKGTDILPPDKARCRFPVVLMTSHGNEQVAVAAMKAGVVDYVVKSPSMFSDMPHIATRALQQWDLLVERNRAEEKLRESEERFRTIFEQGPLGMHIAELDYHFVAFNDAFCRIVGYSAEELSKLTFADITHSDDLETDLEQAQKLLGGQIPYYTMEKRHVGKRGNIKWIALTRSVIRDVGGTPLYFLTMIEDITERKHTEELLRLRAEELARSNEDLAQFAYVASHDLQEPLRNVASCLQLLEKNYKSKLDPNADLYIHYAVEGVVRMKALIQDLLAYSRIGTRGKPFRSIDCELILDQTLKSLRSAIIEAGALITCDPLPSISADDTQLLQVFQNLIQNAIKFRRDEPPQIHVSAIKNKNEWTFSVRDNGIGIESRHFDRIFVIFQRLHKRDQYDGTGMGLAIVKKIVERHRGRVWVESETGKGTTFSFTIPDKALQA